MNKYVNEINGNNKKYRLLSKDEEYNLFEKANKGDEKAFNTLVECNQHNVIKLVHNFYNKKHFDDLYQEANISLIKAIQKFDYESGNRFISYATQVINHDMIKYISEQSCMVKLPITMAGKFKLIEKINESDIDIEKAYKENKISTYMLKAYNIYNKIYTIDNANYLPAPKEYLEKEYLEKDYLDILLPILNADELKVITMCYGLNNSDKKTYKRIAKEMNCSRWVVYDLKKKSLEKMTIKIKEILKKENQ